MAVREIKSDTTIHRTVRALSWRASGDFLQASFVSRREANGQHTNIESGFAVARSIHSGDYFQQVFLDGNDTGNAVEVINGSLSVLEGLCVQRTKRRSHEKRSFAALREYLLKAKDELTFKRLERRGWFEGLDLTQVENDTGFNKKDIVTLLAGVSTEKQGSIREALSSYANLRDEFFADRKDPKKFRNYFYCLTTLIYGENAAEALSQASEFLYKAEREKDRASWVDSLPAASDAERAKRVYYELYVDLFAKDFSGLSEKLDYLQNQGFNTLWLLPFLETTKLDAGFDVVDKKKVQEQLGGNEGFARFLTEAKKRGITVMMDMVLNHLSFQSPEFQAALDPFHPDHHRYKDWFIIREDTNGQPPEDLPAYIIFKDVVMPSAGEGLMEGAGEPKRSNWTRWKRSDGTFVWVYNRFYGQMPDVNYANPEVFIQELENLKFWGDFGRGAISDFRHDALAHIWKMDRNSVHPDHKDIEGLGEFIESYGCDNLPQARLIEFGARAFLEHRYRGHVQVVGEVWQSIDKWVSYFGKRGEGTKDQFGFMMMDAFLNTLLHGKNKYLNQTLGALLKIMPQGVGTLDFLRHHDASASGDTVEGQKSHVFNRIRIPRRIKSKLEEILGRKIKPSVFFDGGYATRLADMILAVSDKKDPSSILENYQLMMSLLFFTASRPLIYMADEFFQRNMPRHLLDVTQQTRGLDGRHIHRSIDWRRANKKLKDSGSLEYKTNMVVKRLVSLRKGCEVLSQGNIRLMEVRNSARLGINHEVFAAQRTKEGSPVVFMLANLSGTTQKISLLVEKDSWPSGIFLRDLITDRDVEYFVEEGKDQDVLSFTLTPRQSLWLTPQ